MDQGNGGRVMALDLGEKRIGVALSDETRLIAASYGVIQRRSRQEDFSRFGQIASEKGVDLIVLGLPVTLGGQEGEKAAWTRDYGAALAQHLQLPVEFWDEALTTVEAEASLRARGIKGKKAKKRVDAVAAAFILQNYLDAHRKEADSAQ